MHIKITILYAGSVSYEFWYWLMPINMNMNLCDLCLSIQMNSISLTRSTTGSTCDSASGPLPQRRSWLPLWWVSSPQPPRQLRNDHHLGRCWSNPWAVDISDVISNRWQGARGCLWKVYCWHLFAVVSTRENRYRGSCLLQPAPRFFVQKCNAR